MGQVSAAFEEICDIANDSLHESDQSAIDEIKTGDLKSDTRLKQGESQST